MLGPRALVARFRRGQIFLSNNAAERALRGIALVGGNWTFAGSTRGADGTAVMRTMITTCRLNDVVPKAWLADVVARIADLPASRLQELLPWEWARRAEPTSLPIGAPPDLNQTP